MNNKVSCLTAVLLWTIACASTAVQPVNPANSETTAKGIVDAEELDDETVATEPSSEKLDGPTVEVLEKNFHPIVVNGELLGGFDGQKTVVPKDFKANCNGRLVSYEEFCCHQISDDPGELVLPDCDLIVDLVKGGEKYQLYDFFTEDREYSGLIIEGRNTGIGEGRRINYHAEGAGNDFYSLKIERPDNHSKEKRPRITVGISGDWNGMPRPIVALGNDAFSVDIDGDGTLDKIRIEKSLVPFEIAGYTKSPRQKGEISVVVQIDNLEHTVSKFTLDGIYARIYALVLLDIDNDSQYEFVEVATGHDRTIEVSELQKTDDGSFSTKLLFGHYVVR